MKGLIRKSLRFLAKIWPFVAILAAVGIFFYPVWLKALVPIPGDFIVGTYFPWLDYKWGYEVGVPVKNPITSDVVSVIYPLRSIGVDLMKKGLVPLWVPNMFVGYPLLANFQTALFSPTILLYFILPKILAWTGQIILQPILAAIFMYLFLKHLNLSKLASVTGGLIYAFAGFNMIWLEWNTHALVAAWIPLIVFLVDKLILTNKNKWGVFLSIALTFQIFSGYPQIVFYTFGAVALFLFFKRKGLGLERYFKVAAFLILGLLLSSVQLASAIELFLNSQRTKELLDPVFRYLPWQNLINFFAPDYFGSPVTGNYWGVGNYTLNLGYTGLITIFLAVIGVAKFFKRKEIKFLLALLFVSFLLTLPNFVSRLLAENNKLGFAALSPTKILIFANFSLAALGAFGLEKLLNKKEKIDIRALYLPLVVLGGTFLGTLIALKLIPFDYIFAGYLKVGIRNLILPLSLVTLLSVVSVIRYKFSSKYVNKLAVLAMAILTVAELFRFGWKFTPFSPAKLVFPETPVITYLVESQLSQKPSPFRVSEGDTIPMNMWVSYNLESPSGYDAVYPQRWAKLISVIQTGNPDAPPSGRYAKFDSYDSPWFDLLNTKYVLSQKLNKLAKPDEQGEVSYKLRGPKFRSVFEDKTVAVLENLKALPRAFLVYDWESLPERDILTNIASGNFKFDKKVLLEEEFTDFEKGTGSGGKARYLDYGPGGSTIEVEASRDGLLFVSEMFYPGWRAFVDGVEEKIYRANYTFRAVPVRLGIHKIEFIYEPESFKIGKWISVSTLLVLLAIWVNGQFKKIGRRTSRTGSA